MNTIERYFNNMPCEYLVHTEKQMCQIADGLRENFGKNWDNVFDVKYVKETSNERLIKTDSAGNVLLHSRVFDRDFGGKMCFGIGGTFKVSKEVSASCLIEVFHALMKYPKFETKLMFGMCPEALARYYQKCVGKSGDYFRYNDELFIYYCPFHGYEVSKEDIEKMKEFELF